MVTYCKTSSAKKALFFYYVKRINDAENKLYITINL